MPNDKATLEKALKLYGFAGVHAAANIVPMMDEEQYLALVEDIRTNGFLNAVKVTGERMLIDGRNRLCASIDVSLDAPVETYNPADPVQYIVSENVKRRHLTVGQRAMIGTSVEEYYAVEGEKRRLANLKQNKAIDTPNSGKRNRDNASAQKAAKAVDVGHDSIEKAKTIKQSAPDLAEEVQQGRSLHSAYTETKERQAARPPADPAPKPTPKQETVTLYDHLGNEVQYPKTKSKATFNRTNNAVQWAWWTWNPVTGCLHGCEYCYAREISLNPSFSAAYPAGFTPLLRHDRLDAPQNTTYPAGSREPEAGRVFVCSMSDLFGGWVPAEWIDKVVAATKAAPKWEYLYLTKNPKRYQEFKMPDNAWIGTTVDSQAKVGNIEEVKKAVGGSVKWVSFEPLIEPIQADFTGIDWVVIGARSGTAQNGKRVPGFAPDIRVVMDITEQAEKAGCRVYMKANLLGQVSDQWPGMKLIQDTP